MCRPVPARLSQASSSAPGEGSSPWLAGGVSVSLTCVAASLLLGRLFGFLSFTWSLGKSVLVLCRHALQVRLNSITQAPGLPEAGYAISNSVPP